MMSKKLVRGLVVGLAAFVIAWVISQTPLFRPLEWKSWDARLSLTSKPSRAGRDIVVFYIDQYSLDIFAEQGVSWPWPRQMYSAVVKYLTAGRAKAVFIDMIFSEASVYGEADDADLARTLSDSGRAFLPFNLSAAREENPRAADKLKSQALSSRALPRGPVASLASVSLPLEPFLNACRGAGNVQFSPDGDGIFRRIPLVFFYKNLTLPALPLALAEFVNGKLDLDKIPLDPTGQMVIR
jgi:adenylate cyclase